MGVSTVDASVELPDFIEGKLPISPPPSGVVDVVPMMASSNSSILPESARRLLVELRFCMAASTAVVVVVVNVVVVVVVDVVRVVVAEMSSGLNKMDRAGRRGKDLSGTGGGREKTASWKKTNRVKPATANSRYISIF